VVVDASKVAAEAPAKSLADRVAYAHSKKSRKPEPLTKTSANPKAQPKSATADKRVTGKDGGKGRPAGKAGKPKRARNPRAKPKTAEELDAEMTDYWAGNNPSTATAPTEAPAANGTAPAPNANEDMGMDEISVSDVEIIC
jgi:THO complex subunit 4